MCCVLMMIRSSHPTQNPAKRKCMCNSLSWVFFRHHASLCPLTITAGVCTCDTCLPPSRPHTHTRMHTDTSMPSRPFVSPPCPHTFSHQVHGQRARGRCGCGEREARDHLHRELARQGAGHGCSMGGEVGQGGFTSSCDCLYGA